MEQPTLVETKNALRQPTNEIVPFNTDPKGFILQYEHQNGRLYQGNSFDWLKSLDDASVDLVFADPPYNIKKADWDNFDSQEKYIEQGSLDALWRKTLRGFPPYADSGAV